jgi:hypothetical protein
VGKRNGGTAFGEGIAPTTEKAAQEYVGDGKVWPSIPARCSERVDSGEVGVMS